MAGATGAGAGTIAGAKACSLTGVTSTTGTGSVPSTDSVPTFGIAAESADSTIAGASTAAVSSSTCGAFSFSMLGFVSTGVEAMVVMPALAFSGS